MKSEEEYMMDTLEKNFLAGHISEKDYAELMEELIRQHNARVDRYY